MTLKMCTVALLLALVCLVAPGAEAGGFTVRDVDGPSAFNFDGFVFIGGTAVPAASTGRFTADGRGNLTDGVRTLVVGGTPFEQTFTCTYTVNSNGTGHADCVILPGPSNESFDFVIVERKKEAFFTAVPPEPPLTGTPSTIRGTTRRQQ